MTTEQARNNLKEAKQSLETLEAKLPSFQRDAAQTALEVSQAKAVLVERKELAKVLTQAQAARELLEQVEMEIMGYQAKVKALMIEVEKQKLLENAANLATQAFNAKLEWEKSARVIHAALEGVAGEAKTCGESLVTMQKARVKFLALTNDLSRSDKNFLLEELRKEGHDLTPLLTRWPQTPVSGLDVTDGSNLVLATAPRFSNLIFALLDIVATENALPSLSQVFEIPFSGTQRAQRVAKPKPGVKNVPDYTQMTDEQVKELLEGFDSENEVAA